MAEGYPGKSKQPIEAHYLWKEHKGDTLDPVAQARLRWRIENKKLPSSTLRRERLALLAQYTNGTLEEIDALPEGYSLRDNAFSGIHYDGTKKIILKVGAVSVVLDRDIQDWNADVFLNGKHLQSNHYRDIEAIEEVINSLRSHS